MPYALSPARNRRDRNRIAATDPRRGRTEVPVTDTRALPDRIRIQRVHGIPLRRPLLEHSERQPLERVDRVLLVDLPPDTLPDPVLDRVPVRVPVRDRAAADDDIQVIRRREVDRDLVRDRERDRDREVDRDHEAVPELHRIHRVLRVVVIAEVETAPLPLVPSKLALSNQCTLCILTRAQVPSVRIKDVRAQRGRRLTPRRRRKGRRYQALRRREPLILELVRRRCLRL